MEYSSGQSSMFEFFEAGPKEYSSMKILDEDISEGKSKNLLKLKKDEKINSLVKNDKDISHLSCEILSIFSKNNVLISGAERYGYIVNKLMEHMRDVLCTCIRTEGETVEYQESEQLCNLIGSSHENPFAQYFRSLVFSPNGSVIAAYFISKKSMISKYWCFCAPKSGDIPYFWTVGPLKPMQRGKQYRKRKVKNSTVTINDVCLLLARAVMFEQIRKRWKEDGDYRTYVLNKVRVSQFRKVLSHYVIENDEVLIKFFKLIQIPVTVVPKGTTIVEGQRVMTRGQLYMISHLYLLLNGVQAAYPVENAWDGKYMQGSDINLVELFHLILKMDYEVIEMQKYEKRQNSDYAASFMSKKSLPKKIKDRMKTSDFNKTFGFVEFDELVDIDKIGYLEQEWGVLSDKLFGNKRYPDVSLRFRLLGKHNATGLYFSHVRCICVDLREPSSMIHEFMHMIDDGTLSGKRKDYLSLKFDFESIKEIYSEHIDSIADVGKGKYDRAYYKNPTEIFARCGEMYVSRVLGISNSLIKDVDGFAYPRKEKLMQLITEYYDHLFEIAFGTRREDLNECVEEKEPDCSN